MPVCVCWAVSLPCTSPLIPSSDRSAGQSNQPSHSTVLARPACPFVCVSAASFPCRFPDESLFQRHLRSVVWVGVWVWDWIHSHTPPRTRSPSSRHPLFTHYPFPQCSLVCGGHPSPHKPRLVVPHSTCPSLSPSPPAHSYIIGPAEINTHTPITKLCAWGVEDSGGHAL